MSYDSTIDTTKHITALTRRMTEVRDKIISRALLHDESKLKPPEKEIFDEMTPLLKDCTYGSDEYKGFLARMTPALDHHYKHNKHHPEHWLLGVRSMSMIDLLEMLADWKAAGERHADGSMFNSLSHNRVRFDIREDLFRTLCITAREMEWIDAEELGLLRAEAFRAENP